MARGMIWLDSLGKGILDLGISQNSPRHYRIQIFCHKLVNNSHLENPDCP